MEKFVFASHLSKPKIRNKACDFPKPITSQTLLNCISNNYSVSDWAEILYCRSRPPRHTEWGGGGEGGGRTPILALYRLRPSSRNAVAQPYRSSDSPRTYIYGRKKKAVSRLPLNDDGACVCLASVPSPFSAFSEESTSRVCSSLQ